MPSDDTVTLRPPPPGHRIQVHPGRLRSRPSTPEQPMAQVTLRDPEWPGYELPPVCMRCGAEATVCKAKRFTWYPPWVNLLILAGLIPYAVVVAILTKRLTVSVPLCGRHRFHWGGRVL